MNKPKVLFLDIESSPNVGLFWSAGYKINVPSDNIIRERQIICICWKWQGEKTVHSLDYGKDGENEKEMLKDITLVINQADLIVGHNHEKFDMAFIRSRLLCYGLPPFGVISTEDTYRLSAKTFYLNSYSLNYMSKFIGVGEKIRTDYAMWKDILLRSSSTALRKMVKYCKNDVVIQEKVYDKISPFVTHSVNKALLGISPSKFGCPSCGSMDVQRYGLRTTRVAKQQRWKCNGCAHVYTTVIELKKKNAKKR